mmetsp:Transcript_4330/g.16284  ORF Transcript_4330/g.16284 Transcript_4330/m.16284 type:complete len:528 (-) Transcript_4330:732-2315(-)
MSQQSHLVALIFVVLVSLLSASRCADSSQKITVTGSMLKGKRRLTIPLSPEHAQKFKNLHNEAENALPSMNAVLTPASISYLQSVFQPIIIKQIQEIQLDDIQQEIDTPIGKLGVNLSNLKMNQFDIKDIQVSLAEGQGMTIKVNNAHAQLSLDWNYRRVHSPHLSDHGTADANVGSNTQLLMTAKVVPLGNSTTLDITIPSFDMDIFQFDLHLHGGASWLYNIFISSFKKAIVKGIEQSLHDNISDIVQKEARAVLSTINLNMELLPGLAADFSFADFIFHSTGIVSEHVALVKATGKPVFPDSPPTLPSVYQPKASDMVQLFLADTLFNSAGYSIQQLGLVQYIIGNNILPEWFPIKLTTAAFCFFIPKVCTMYPISKDMQIAIVSGSAPRMKFDPSVGVETILDLAAEFQVINGTLDTLFTLDATVVLDSAISMQNGTTLVAQFTMKNMTISLKDSEIGSFDVSILGSFMNSVINYILLPLMNIFGQKGLEIPSVQGLTLLNPFVGVLDRMLVISANYKYAPPQ